MAERRRSRVMLRSNRTRNTRSLQSECRRRFQGRHKCSPSWTRHGARDPAPAVLVTLNDGPAEIFGVRRDNDNVPRVKTSRRLRHTYNGRVATTFDLIQTYRDGSTLWSSLFRNRCRPRGQCGLCRWRLHSSDFWPGVVHSLLGMCPSRFVQQ